MDFEKCVHCGEGIELIQERWAHIIDRPHGEEHYLYCRSTVAEPVRDVV